ncbi:hypothetical protein A3A93_01920 [Candidatus Roizmanbacteria bacterium RIFCSPLOWO2_01_FULL_38_12]|uniref:SH3b domain-containing protein n=1 Tax=Candidatus Roizmanbacteria bacterium RIFCSPLOWO2_01_FULL_38_12 TaxID=1802061 RepID=A0A1F7IXV4_9BACT|nr:MAG: hypothetical protein A2861_01440 [Candidatus Roizmanbacteria bacterium RIFCSPHIGHO2_01_FULL_38_15]OGK35283.1 MAG: hypothetical protein A3F59_02845 [Candidatus Roizmanbacteria bacterium RIFCSPHIGHO2_12_FULL_38_13]OGK48209.1 MAG: hypothetical protein A3A93_01920 [Candidatus Roizmanbacteria bacterium RIFCSPLOWO2_01_FULL_38_12]
MKLLMKAKIILITVLIVAFLAFIFIKFFIQDRQNAAGRLKIESSPDAGVFIDDVAVGKTPFDNSGLKVGEHKIKLIPEGKDTKAVGWEGKVSIYKNTTSYISRELGTSQLTSAGEILTIVKMKDKPNGQTGSLTIETDPPGAIAYLDNDEKGVSPLELKDIPTGDHELSVYLPGFFRRIQKIKIETGFQTQAVFKLAVDQFHKTLPEELEKQKQKEATAESKLTVSPTDEESSDEASLNTSNQIEILDNDLGYLNVRSEPLVSGDIVTKVNPGETYEYTDTENGWYYITLDDGSVGWVSGDYVEIVE